MTDYKKMSVYQIYPKSFQDSNGDGIGDINGIISRLPYIADMGVEYIWLTSVYISPGNDNGYDIADYYNIDPVYGTTDDFKNLLHETHKSGLEIMMDIVVTHISTEHKSICGLKNYQNKQIIHTEIFISGKKIKENFLITGYRSLEDRSGCWMKERTAIIFIYLMLHKLI
jgi:glycosidase